jgi:hypothetical protein
VVAQAVTSNSATSRKTMFFIVFPSVKKGPTSAEVGRRRK